VTQLLLDPKNAASPMTYMVLNMIFSGKTLKMQMMRVTEKKKKDNDEEQSENENSE
jgi:hypothetical protein